MAPHSPLNAFLRLIPHLLSRFNPSPSPPPSGGSRARETAAAAARGVPPRAPSAPTAVPASPTRPSLRERVATTKPAHLRASQQKAVEEGGATDMPVVLNPRRIYERWNERLNDNVRPEPTADELHQIEESPAASDEEWFAAIEAARESKYNCEPARRSVRALAKPEAFASLLARGMTLVARKKRREACAKSGAAAVEGAQRPAERVSAEQMRADSTASGSVRRCPPTQIGRKRNDADERHSPGIPDRDDRPRLQRGASRDGRPLRRARGRRREPV